MEKIHSSITMKNVLKWQYGSATVVNSLKYQYKNSLKCQSKKILKFQYGTADCKSLVTNKLNSEKPQLIYHI